MRRGLLAVTVAFAAWWLAPTTAFAQRAQFSVDDRPYADVPFALTVAIEGFEESPPPEQPKLEVPNATVTPAGVRPNVARSIQIDGNGRRRDQTVVTWMMQWRVTARAGTLRIPSLTIKQGDRSATAQGAQLTVEAVPTSDEMKLRLVLPDRTVYVGETIPVRLEWLFRAQPESQTFAVPFAALDSFTISAPPVPQGSRRALELDVGAKPMTVPYELDRATVDGVDYNRLAITLLAAPTKPGRLDVPPASVIAALQVGTPDFFGRARTKMLRASDVARSLEVKPLPERDRPPAFAGAVGEQFSIEVRTSRSVVSLGEPVELMITIKSDQRLDTLGLGKLDGPGRLPGDKFTVPAEPPIGELLDDGKTKRFQVVAQVAGATSEIPALAFAYFDPKKASYQTIYSEPIALSLKGGSVVDSSAVVIHRKGSAAPATSEPVADVAAELALSSPSAADAAPLGGLTLWLLVGLLYAIPLTILAVRTWQLRTAGDREEASEAARARDRLDALLGRAEREPAREITGPLVVALGELARTTDASNLDEIRSLIARIETEGFAPKAASEPLDPALITQARAVARQLGAPRPARSAGRAATIVIILVAAASGRAEADPIADGRAAYQQAMDQHDPSARRTAFARAAIALGEAAREHPDRPELIADWGNAALGAGDLATATLAYRRALAIDPANARARRNLGFLRDKLPSSLQPSASAGAADTLLFFHRWPRSQRWLVGGAAFALAVLLIVPWSGRRRRMLGGVAIIFLIIWLAMIGSLIIEDRRINDGVVMDSAMLRAADHAGAPAALPQPLPRGLEVTIREQRAAWVRVELPNGTIGWIPDGAVERVQ